MQSKPQLLIFATCDGVHVEPSTGKHYLMGIFSSLRARDFPVVHPQMVWFISLTDVSVGEHTLNLSLGLPGMQPLMSVSRPFESKSPLHRIHIINQLQNVHFDQPGDYTAAIEVDDEPILVTSFGVIALGNPPTL
ncbi:hypothetical protein H5P28_14875 [Ruficoccus amylovorans]|uniref:Uncharacterized protein n=1 Tax=Ruficoccus amylovorans TaxID=1804625 RepID=A0A842HHS4_9BACT|nr:hypothetical protein [Ruficoccus amylovorans]MBC2595548.1 hypothetical protein [Ruficoccus amylovorans]